MQSITAMRLLLRSGQIARVLLVCPKPLVTNWQREFALWAPEIPVAVVQGDRRCTVIAAASILAKVTRDRWMTDLHKTDPRYGFDRHKGYATNAHLNALARFGYSSAHRRSFRPASLFDKLKG